jgi:hypothetical protein
MFTHPSGETVTRGAIGYVKQRIILAANNKVYEFPTTTDAIGDEHLYTLILILTITILLLPLLALQSTPQVTLVSILQFRSTP